MATTVGLRCIFIGFLLLTGSSFAVAKAHTVVLGQWRSVEVRTEAGEKQPLKVRELVIDGRFREYVTGAAHEVTDRLFVVRRAYRINDALPEEKKPQQWVWRLDGWISIDRQTGHVAQLNLPAFDGETSEASWYRDYAAYCGASDDGSKTYMVVSQLGKRKPISGKNFPGLPVSLQNGNGRRVELLSPPPGRRPALWCVRIAPISSLKLQKKRARNNEVFAGISR